MFPLYQTINPSHIYQKLTPKSKPYRGKEQAHLNATKKKKKNIIIAQ
jgi:hypothetical protein